MHLYCDDDELTKIKNKLNFFILFFHKITKFENNVLSYLL